MSIAVDSTPRYNSSYNDYSELSSRPSSSYSHRPMSSHRTSARSTHRARKSHGYSNLPPDLHVLDPELVNSILGSSSKRKKKRRVPKNMHHDAEDLYFKVQQLKKGKSQLETELKLSKTKIHRLESDVARRNRQIDQLLNSAGSSSPHFHQMRSERSLIGNLKDQVYDLREKLKKSDEKVLMLGNSDQQSIITTLEHQLDAVRVERDGVELHMHELKDRLRSKGINPDTLEIPTVNSDEKLNKIKGLLRKERHESNSLRDNIATLKGKLDILEKRCSVQEQQIQVFNDQKQRRMSMERFYKSQKEVEDLSGQVTSHRNVIKGQKKSIQRMESEISEMRKELNRTQLEKDTFETRNKAMKNEVVQLENDRATLLQSVQESDNALRHAKNNLEKVKTEKKVIKEVVQELKKENQNLRMEVYNLKTQNATSSALGSARSQQSEKVMSGRRQSLAVTSRLPTSSSTLPSANGSGGLSFINESNEKEKELEFQRQFELERKQKKEKREKEKMSKAIKVIEKYWINYRKNHPKGEKKLRSSLSRTSFLSKTNSTSNLKQQVDPSEINMFKEEKDFDYMSASSEEEEEEYLVDTAIKSDDDISSSSDLDEDLLDEDLLDEDLLKI
ncbi:hypothetical protein PCE1_000120 [Barthelona sp. PCE]